MTGYSIKNLVREGRIFESRLLWSAVLAALLALLLLVRLVYLQVVHHRHYVTLSQNNRISILPVPPVRGLIFDRRGTLLAENVPAYTLEVVPDQVPDMAGLLKKLRGIVQLSDADLARFRRLRRQRPGFESLPLRARLSETEAARFAVHRHELAGVELNARLQRYYPQGALGVHLVGYVGRIGPEDLARLRDKVAYRGLRYIGKLGVEASYEDVLRGRAGVERIETNAHGRRVRLLDRRKPVAGRNLYLGVDARLQRVAEEAMGPYRGAVVALDPASGDVLAFASVPTYDPNPFVNGIAPGAYQALRRSPDRPLINRALAGRYAPGSTIKAFLGLAALEAGRQASRRTLCPGYFTLPHSRHRYRCWRKRGHGLVDLHDAIVQSCDVYFYDLAAELGIERLHDALTAFGFGKLTGIDLKGEVSGLIPSPAWKRRVHGQPWYPGETVIAGIGQGYTLVTPLQLANGLALIANRGWAMRPHVVHAMQDRASGRITPIKPERLPYRPVSRDAYYDTVIRALTDVVHGPRGTARRIGYGADYRIAGKTGTAQVIGVDQDETYDPTQVAERHRDHALFIAFAPVAAPRIVVAVVVENGGHGGATAAPIARKVMDYYLHEVRVAPRTGEAVPAAGEG